MTKEYSNGEVTVVWTPDKCIHSGICVKTLPKVYNTSERPWVKPENATSEELVVQCAMCPSGALSIKTIRYQQEDNGKKGRFILYFNDEFAGEMTYTWAGEETIIIDHTGVEEKFGGKGFGKALLEQVLLFTRGKDLKIIPLCPFVKRQLEKND